MTLCTALQEYNPRLFRHYRILINIFDHHAASKLPVDASQSFMDLFFDVVSDLTFGKSFDSLTTKQRNPIIGEFIKEQKAVGYMLMNMWVFYLIRCLPMVKALIKEWLCFYGNALEERRNVGYYVSLLHSALTLLDENHISRLLHLHLSIRRL